MYSLLIYLLHVLLRWLGGRNSWGFYIVFSFVNHKNFDRPKKGICLSLQAIIHSAHPTVSFSGNRYLICEELSDSHSITNSKHRHRLRGCLSDVKLVATGFNGKTYKELDVFPSSYVLGLFRTRPHRQGDCQASSFSDQLYVDNVTLRLSGTSFPPDRTALPNFMFAI